MTSNGFMCCHYHWVPWCPRVNLCMDLFDFLRPATLGILSNLKQKICQHTLKRCWCKKKAIHFFVNESLRWCDWISVLRFWAIFPYVTNQFWCYKCALPIRFNLTTFVMLRIYWFSTKFQRFIILLLETWPLKFTVTI